MGRAASESTDSSPGDRPVSNGAPRGLDVALRLRAHPAAVPSIHLTLGEVDVPAVCDISARQGSASACRGGERGCRIFG